MIDNSSLSVNNPASTSHQSALMLFFAYFELIVRLYKILESICGGGPTSAAVNQQTLKHTEKTCTQTA